MTFTEDVERRRLPLIFYSFFVILKWITQRQKNVSYYSPQIQILSLYCTGCWRQTAKVSFLPFAVWRNVMFNLSIVGFCALVIIHENCHSLIGNLNKPWIIKNKRTKGLPQNESSVYRIFVLVIIVSLFCIHFENDSLCECELPREVPMLRERNVFNRNHIRSLIGLWGIWWKTCT